MKLLATNCYAGGGQPSEAAQQGQGLKTFCLMSNLFGAGSAEEIKALLATAIEAGVSAVILDGHWTPECVPAISYSSLAFAADLERGGIETFFLVRTEDDGFSCELWRGHKPMKFPDMEEVLFFVARVGRFHGEVFEVGTGRVLQRSHGDSGQESTRHKIREGFAFKERDWPAIVAAVERELTDFPMRKVG